MHNLVFSWVVHELTSSCSLTRTKICDGAHLKIFTECPGGAGHCCSCRLQLPDSLKPSIRLSMVEDVNIAPFWTQKDLRDVVFRFLREAAHSSRSDSAWGDASGAQRFAVCARDLRLSSLPVPSSSIRAGCEGVGVSSFDIITTKRPSLSSDIY